MFPPPPDDPSNPDQPTAPLDPPDPPSLERLEASPDDVVPPDAPLKQYVLNEETEVVRDLPFGAPAFGGETPFFTSNDSSQAAWDTDDTEGIPTGLPDLLDLPPLSELPTEAPEPEAVAAPVEPEVIIKIDRRAVAQARHRGHVQAAVAFVAGAVVSVIVWLIYLSQIQ